MKLRHSHFARGRLLQYYNVSESVFPPSDEVEGSTTMLTKGARRATGVSIVWPPLDSLLISTVN